VKKLHHKIIVLGCVLFLQLGLFASLAHAVQHPFHVQDELCASFINFSHHDLSANVVSLTTESCLFTVDVLTDSYTAIELPFYSHYCSRAPPFADA
jgi:hypothetical protein